MIQVSKIAGLLTLLAFFAVPVLAADSTKIPERVLGKATAPITVEEYVSLTCSHCAEFYNNILPELEKRYVETGKVKFILRDFPLDGTALKAAALARCMPADGYYPFIKALYKNLGSWVTAGPEVDKRLIQYATFSGLDADKAKSCLLDTAMQDAIVAGRAEATEKFSVQATPTFIINGGAEKLQGAEPVEIFASVFDRLLADKK